MERIKRRDFLRFSLGISSKYLLGELPAMSLVPHPQAGLTNLSEVPHTLFRQANTEPLLYPINFDSMFVPGSDHVNRSKKNGNLYGYGDGIKESIRRGQEVFLVLEFPGESDPIPTEDWATYVRGLAGEYSGAHFVLGNEINMDSNRKWRDQPDQFALFYLVASEAIGTHSPSSRVYMYGEAYNENGETLKVILGAMRNVSSQVNIPQRIDGLTFHYYDVAAKLSKRVQMYQDMMRANGIPPVLHLTELGKLEGARLTESEHSDVVTQNLATALSIHEKGDIQQVFWHTAHAGDPNGHSLMYYDAEGMLRLKSSFNQFWTVSKLLHHGIRNVSTDAETVITGSTSNGEEVEIRWNSNPRSENPAVEGVPSIKIQPVRFSGNTVLYR